MEEDDFEDDGGYLQIYPGRVHYHYPPHHLVALSERAIHIYNHNKGNTFRFVELVQGLMAYTMEADTIITIFTAHQSDDMIVTFRAEAYSASRDLTKDLSDPNLHIKVGRCDPESRSLSYLSDFSYSESEYESEPESGSFPYQTEKLGAQVELLQISS